MKNLKRDIDFIIELDKLKKIKRKTKLIGTNIEEDDAQHSWHISIMALILEEYADEDLDILKVLEMLLIHDLVEIYAGDTFAYDEEGHKDKEERELKAANKLYSLLGEKKGDKFKSLWLEFEEGKSKEAVFAIAMDRLQPILLNYHNSGGTWKEYGIKKEQILKRVKPVMDTSKELGKFINELLDTAVIEGKLSE